MNKKHIAEMIRQWTEHAEAAERRAEQYDNAAKQLTEPDLSKWDAFLRLMATDERAAAKRARAIITELEDKQSEIATSSRAWHDMANRFGEAM